MNAVSHHLYNPDWLSDDAVVGNFVARQNEFAFLRDELARSPLTGSVQHYLLVGVRGAGKTTLLKRLAVAVRHDEDLRDHLIALSFPEELYQIKHLADFWWAACEALADALDAQELSIEADRLIEAAHIRGRTERDDAMSDAGLMLLMQTCARLQRRPVLLVDNLGVIFDRIDKNGRKLNDPNSPAYWALREALSTSTSPILIAGSVRLSSPFTDYDKAFYDFFIPMRLGKLSLQEVRNVLERLADAQGCPEVKHRLHARPGRVEVLFDLTGGNPRALGLIFELLRQGPNSRSVQDFERLMDLTTPYYKARIEDLSDQAQVVMHALAVRRPNSKDQLRFGHTAAEIGDHGGLPTSTVSSQLGILENEGLVEKTAAHGRTQYRIAEQLFRLWLQMRSTRRIRQNVIELTKFFEAMYEIDELQEKATQDCGADALSAAKYAMAVASVRDTTAAQREKLESYAADRLHEHVELHGGELEEYLPKDSRSPSPLPSSAACVKRGVAAWRSGKLEKAATAFQQAIALDPRNGVALFSLGDLERRLGNIESARDLYDQAIALFKNSKNRQGLPVALKSKGDLESLIGNVAQSKALYNEAIDLFQDAQNQLGLAKAFTALGSLERRLGNLGRARELCTEAVAILRTEGHDRGLAGALASLGDLERRLGNLDLARALYDEALELLKRDKDDRGRADTLTSLGDLERGLGDIKRARGLYNEALTLFENTRDDLGRANTLTSIGDLERRLGNLESARGSYDEAIDLYKKVHDDLGRANALQSKGDLERRLGRKQLALDLYNEAIALYLKEQDDMGRANALKSLGDLERNSGKIERARSFYDEAIALFQKVQDDHGRANALDSLGDLESLTGATERARVLYGEAIVLYRKAHDDLGLANALKSSGDLEIRQGNLDAARDLNGQAAALYLKEKDDLGRANSLASLGTIERKRGNLKQASSLYSEAIQLFQKAQDNLGCSNGLRSMGEVERDLRNHDRARELYDKAAEGYRREILLDPGNALAWADLAFVLERLDQDVAALEAYQRAATLNAQLHPIWRARHADLQARLGVAAARQALTAKDSKGLEEALTSLFGGSVDIAAVLVSRHIVEDFLAQALSDVSITTMLRDAIRTLPFERHARPLVLAFEAAVSNRAEMLEELEPEMQAATKHMFERLTASLKQNHKPKRPEKRKQ